MNLELEEIEAVKRLMCVKTAVASLLLASAAGAWAPAQQLVSSAPPITWPYNGGFSTAIGVAATVPATYVVVAEANTVNALEVIAWQNTTSALVQVGIPQVVDTAGISAIYGVAITGLDSTRVVTADIDNTGNLSINTWTVGPAGVAHQNVNGTGPGVAYQNVAITSLSSTQVVTAYQQADQTLAVEAWTIGTDGYPTPEGQIATGDPAIQVSIAAVNANQVVTAINDTKDLANVLQVATWGVDSAGVQPLHHKMTGYQVTADGESVGVGAGSKFRLQDHFPYLEQIQSAVTPIIFDDNVEVVDWGISESGELTQTNKPVSTATFNDVAVAGLMLPQNAPITAYGNNDGSVYVGGAPVWPVVNNAVGNGIDSIAMTTSGTGKLSFFSNFYDAYFVTAVLAYQDDLSGAAANPTAVLKLNEYSYQVSVPFPII
jgi:hypothetical protein